MKGKLMTTTPTTENPLYHIATHKEVAGQHWVNGYTASCDGDVNAEALARAIVDVERSISFEQVRFTHAVASVLPDPTGENGVNIQIDAAGTRSSTGRKLAPLTECIYVALGNNTLRYGRKFYRGAVLAGDLSAGAHNGYSIDDLAGASALYNPLLAPLVTSPNSNAAAHLVAGKHHKPVVSATVRGYSVVALHRGWYQKGRYRAAYKAGTNTK